MTSVWVMWGLPPAPPGASRGGVGTVMDIPATEPVTQPCPQSPEYWAPAPNYQSTLKAHSPHWFTGWSWGYSISGPFFGPVDNLKLTFALLTSMIFVRSEDWGLEPCTADKNCCILCIYLSCIFRDTAVVMSLCLHY